MNKINTSLLTPFGLFCKTWLTSTSFIAAEYDRTFLTILGRPLFLFGSIRGCLNRIINNQNMADLQSPGG